MDIRMVMADGEVRVGATEVRSARYVDGACVKGSWSVRYLSGIAPAGVVRLPAGAVRLIRGKA